MLYYVSFLNGFFQNCYHRSIVLSKPGGVLGLVFNYRLTLSTQSDTDMIEWYGFAFLIDKSVSLASVNTMGAIWWRYPFKLTPVKMYDRAKQFSCKVTIVHWRSNSFIETIWFICRRNTVLLQMHSMNRRASYQVNINLMSPGICVCCLKYIMLCYDKMHLLVYMLFGVVAGPIYLCWYLTKILDTSFAYLGNLRRNIIVGTMWR